MITPEMLNALDRLGHALASDVSPGVRAAFDNLEAVVRRDHATERERIDRLNGSDEATDVGMFLSQTREGG